MDGQITWRQETMSSLFVSILLWIVLVGLVQCASDTNVGDSYEHGQSELGTIAFASVGRGHFAFDLFSVGVPDLDSLIQTAAVSEDGLPETKLTDGVSVNYNGQFVGAAEKSIVLSHLEKDGIEVSDSSSVVIFVSERSGSSAIYFGVYVDKHGERETGDGHAMQQSHADSIERRPTFENENGSPNRSSSTSAAPLPFDAPVLFDRPIVSRGSILFVSTAEPGNGLPRQSWAAVYSTDLTSSTTVRLTPKGVADFSPSVSPSGEWVAVASYGTTGLYTGETDELLTDLYAYRAEDGSSRRLLVHHGGWPSWADERTIFYHRKADDGWWSVFRIVLPEDYLQTGEGSVQEERITPPGVHAITPAASPTGGWIAVATRRPSSTFRHVEVFDLASKSFVNITEKISPKSNHYSPFVSESGSLGYHRCRGNPTGSSVIPRVQPVRSPIPGLALVRVDGTFPTFSPDGSLLGVIWNSVDSTFGLTADEEGVYVLDARGTNQRRVYSGKAFGVAWDPIRKGVLYTSVGPEFKSLRKVNIMAIHNVDGVGEPVLKQLTEKGNNALPSPSPDGQYVVFRSKRSGFKNLYIIDAMEGEKKYIRKLTDGNWTDTHPAWSPTGEWIAFVSNRENPHISTFGKCSIYLIRPDGTGLRKIIESAEDGLTVHPYFSPDGKKLVFVADLAGVSTEPVSGAAQFQPFGEVFMADIDGSNKQRLTHNGVEDGTPSWSPKFLSAADLSREGSGLKCDATDVTWLKAVSKVNLHRSSFESSSMARGHCAAFHSSSVNYE